MKPPFPESFRRFTLLEALAGRRSRRVALGSEIPAGPLRFTSRHPPLPLSPSEQALVLLAASGNTGWNHLIPYCAQAPEQLPSYAGAAGGRTFPSAAGFHTSQLFFTDDEGTWLFDTRDAPSLAPPRQATGEVDLVALLEAHRARRRRLTDARLDLPRQLPWTEAHNTWVANAPGSTLLMPVGDLAQHFLLGLCYLVLNGTCVSDDLTGKRLQGLERFRGLVDLDEPLPLSFLEQVTLQEVTAELAMSCYAGALALQAMGLGGWMFDGLFPYAVLGAVTDGSFKGLGFRSVADPRWSLPNPVGLPGVFEATCPPNFPTVKAAVEAVIERKFKESGPFNPSTPGPWRNTRRVRATARAHDEALTACVISMAEQLFDRFGRLPPSLPSVLVSTYLQAHHADLEFYERYYEEGACLRTHLEHMQAWHPEPGG